MILFKETLEHDVPIEEISLKKVEKLKRPLDLQSVQQDELYEPIRPVTEKKKKICEVY